MKFIFSLFFFASTIFASETKEENLFQTIPDTQYQTTFWKMILILFALIGLMIISVWLFKRISKVKITQANAYKTIKILEKRVLSPKSMLYIIEVDGKKIILSESHLEVKKIKDLDS